jgi:hypothetical protein
MRRFLSLSLFIPILALAGPPDGRWANSVTEIRITKASVAIDGVEFPFAKETVVDSAVSVSTEFLSGTGHEECTITTRKAELRGDAIVLLKAYRARPTSFLGGLACGLSGSVAGFAEPHAYTQYVLKIDASDAHKLNLQSLDVMDYLDRPILDEEQLLDPALSDSIHSDSHHVILQNFVLLQ